MLENLFENCGKKLQGIARIFLILGAIASVILAFVFGRDWGDFDFWRFLAILVGGGAFVYVNSLLIYAFGLIVEKNEGQVSAVRQQGTVVRQQGTVLTAEDREKEERRVLAEGGWKCSCGRVNSHYISSCACGKNRREGEVKVQ